MSEKITVNKSDAVTVPASGLTTIATIRNFAASRTLLCFHFDVATQALDDFDVLVRSHPAGDQEDITPGAWGTLSGESWRLKYASGDLAAVAAAGSGYLEMDITGLVEVEIKASAASDSAAVTPAWSLS